MKLRDVLFIAIVALVFGLFYLGMVYFGAFLTSLLTPFGLGILGYEPIYGVWFMAAIFITYVMRTKFVGIVAEMLAAFLEVLMGNMFGPIVFVSGFIQGVGSELGFLAFGYRKFGYAQTCLAAFGATVLSFFWTGFRQGYHTFAPLLVLAIFSIRLVSALFFGGLVTKWLADGLAKAGVLSSFAIADEQKDNA